MEPAPHVPPVRHGGAGFSFSFVTNPGMKPPRPRGGEPPVTGAARYSGRHDGRVRESARVSGLVAPAPGSGLRVCPMITEAEQAEIDAYVSAIVEAAPDLTPEQLDRLRALVNPPVTPRPGADQTSRRGRPGGVHRARSGD